MVDVIGKGRRDTSWCKHYDALFAMQSTSIWSPRHEPMLCERYMGERVRRFWFRLAHTVRPHTMLCDACCFPKLESTSRWVAEYELRCLHRWSDHVIERYGSDSEMAQTWNRGLNACKVLMNEYNDWDDTFNPPHDWENNFTCLVQDLFNDAHLKSTSTQPTMIQLWFEEIVRFWVPFLWGPRDNNQKDLTKRLHVWRRELQNVREWIERHMTYFEHPDLQAIQQARTLLYHWNEAYEAIKS